MGGGLVEPTDIKPLALFTPIQMSQLSSANASRCNGSTAGFGYLSGSIPSGDMRSEKQINDVHNTLKLMAKAQRVGDWQLYTQLQSTLTFS